MGILTDFAGTIPQARQIATMDTTELQHGQQLGVISMDTTENNQ